MAGIKYLFKSSFIEEPLKNNQLRKLNLKQFIVRELYHHTNLSIHNLARTIKMSTPTITRALEELISEGLVTEIGIGESTGGRRPSIYGLNPLSRFVIGIDIERYFIRIGLFNFANQPVSEIHELNTGLETQSDIIGFITEKISELIEAYGVDENNILGIGISLPGLIDMRTGLSYTYLNTGKPVADRKSVV